MGVQLSVLGCPKVIKFNFSEKANLKKSPPCFDKSADYLLGKRQNKREIFFKFCGLLTMSSL
jgi:uncharacterized protein (DUF2141 family)